MGIGELDHYFTILSYFVEFKLNYKLLFPDLKKSNYFLRYYWSKSENTLDCLWETQTKKNIY